MKTYLTGLSLVAAVALSCCGQKAASEESNKSALTEEVTFNPKGYTSGTIVQSKAQGDCEWAIQLENGDFVETMDMDKTFLESGKKVWLKYTPQRRMQRCTKASPVAVSEMVIRD
ncbi:hypothetical protein [Dokdonia sp. Hel_I_53]|uniref:hypothetical protein n=1 Tax=Dokdonia sp. Hel_I_53 TaxID=1566287 RepID=UPI0011AB1034|nr:hypothetical protein [Dokdonia sp. Hel_I_53]